MNTFYKWLVAQKYRNDLIGQLSREIGSDDNLPIRKSKRYLLAHITYRGMSSDSFEVAWQEYKRFRSNMIK